MKANLANASDHMYLRKLVIEVHISSTQISSQQSGVGGEDGGNRQLPLSRQNQAQASQPLMEMSHNVWGVLALCCILQQQ